MESAEKRRKEAERRKREREQSGVKEEPNPSFHIGNEGLSSPCPSDHSTDLLIP